MELACLENQVIWRLADSVIDLRGVMIGAK